MSKVEEIERHGVESFKIVSDLLATIGEGKANDGTARAVRLFNSIVLECAESVAKETGEDVLDVIHRISETVRSER